MSITPEFDKLVQQATPGPWKLNHVFIYNEHGNIAACGNPTASKLVGYTPVELD